MLIPDTRFWILDKSSSLQKLFKDSVCIQYQASSIKYQASSIKHPESSIQHQASRIKYPASNIQHIFFLTFLFYLRIL